DQRTPVSGAPFGFACIVGGLTRQPSPRQQRDTGEGGNGVVLLPRRETEEEEDHERPQKEKQIRSSAAVHSCAKSLVAQRYISHGLGKKYRPRHEPKHKHHPEKH